MDGVTALLRESLEAGLTLRLDGESLRVRGPRRAEGLARRLLDCKAEVLEALDWYGLEERAAILEHDGGLPRDEAERRALLARLPN
ncbi:MAG: hypothetical protein K8I02_05170 [Candidatus Methylomirabilis sp.]|nr:hypothetical protein [Deltaproteobacteria bacterium]